MEMELWIRQEFEAAHNLSGTFPPGHQCSQVHGHRYEVRIHLVTEDTGQDVMVDYHEMHAGLADELERLDHRNLNEVMDMPPTCENIARDLFRRLAKRWPELIRVEVQEQSSTGCAVSK